MSGIALVIIFAAAIAIMVVAISKWHLHPFIAILLTALIFGIVSGIHLPQMTTLIGSGFEEMVENSLKRSGPILFITAAGSVLGNIVAGIVAPFAEAMGLASPIGLTLICMAVGAGSMTVSHSNDSYFWVVTKFGRMDIKSGYKTQTLATLILGLGALAELYIISLFI